MLKRNICLTDKVFEQPASQVDETILLLSLRGTYIDSSSSLNKHLLQKEGHVENDAVSNDDNN